MEALLRQKLGSTDFFARIDDVTYLVTMPSTDPEDVNVICLRVAYDLYTDFLGQCDIGHINVYTASDGGDNALALHPLPAERIIALAERAGIHDFNLPSGPRVAAIQSMPGSGERAVISPDGSKLPTPKPSSLVVTHQFVPVWSVQNNAVTTYLCEPKSIMTAEAPQKLLTRAQLTPKEQIQVELSCLYTGVTRLADLIQKGACCLLGISVSFDVLGSPAGRMEFLSACRDLSQEYRQYLEFTIMDVPPGAAQTKLNNLTNTLRPFGRRVSATVAPGSRYFSAYQGIGLRAIGLSEQERPDQTGLRKEDIAILVAAAKTMKLSSFINTLRKLETLKNAHAANIQFLSGPAIAPPCDELKAMSRLTWKEVLSPRIATV
ncbi:MAG: hypothetical protein KGJ79_05245 [Alphaproteobacteria bacterium]|nr:hypothetical protein [Alphaproteobacteria bacterium]